MFKRHLFFHGVFEDSVLLRQGIQGLYCLLVHVVLYLALRLPIRLFNKRCSPSHERTASFSVASAVARYCVPAWCSRRCTYRHVHDDLNLCQSRNIGCPLIVLGRAAWLAVLPLTGLVIIVRMVATGGPLASPRITVLHVFASRSLLYQEDAWPYSRALRVI